MERKVIGKTDMRKIHIIRAENWGFSMMEVGCANAEYEFRLKGGDFDCLKSWIGPFGL